jgi:hypothetical protein
MTNKELIKLRRRKMKSNNKSSMKKLIEKRKPLILKRHKGEITNSDEINLRLIEQELDCLEDAEIGDALDNLERFVQMHEMLSFKINQVLTLIKKKEDEDERTCVFSRRGNIKNE